MLIERQAVRETVLPAGINSSGLEPCGIVHVL